MTLAHVTSETVAAAYGEGVTIDELAERFGVGRGTIWRRLRAAGVPPRRQGGARLPRSIRVPTDPATLGYIAGMLDGEGTIYRRRMTERGCSARVTIYSTTAEVIDWLQATVGGHVRWDHNRVERRGWKPMGSWEISRASDVTALLDAILPFLIIKRDLAVETLGLLNREPAN